MANLFDIRRTFTEEAILACFNGAGPHE